jgi:hypothetical protein
MMMTMMMRLAVAMGCIALLWVQVAEAVLVNLLPEALVTDIFPESSSKCTGGGTTTTSFDLT